MKTTVSLYDFRREFEQCRPDNFSYQGLGVLFEYFEEYENDTSEEIELDVIAMCCEFSEAPFLEIAAMYDIEIDPEASEEDQQKQVSDHLMDQGAYVGETQNSIIYRDF
tara:strand:+ start:692 stop:1018 length:327 start_codon:yes stop_codon:yes gene_type:complete